ncbi:hypothetical protein NXS10_05535 [Streptococcus sp. SQ9-PEA]|uniref:Uncharacterized protein n=2 Tax=Streptococcus sciuri TaxID=2973939 RepID=A0ABT2F7N4_9STRE|nr:hypothetical protein [Streptococcus sciuri]
MKSVKRNIKKYSNKIISNSFKEAFYHIFIFTNSSVKADEIPVLPASEVIAKHIPDAIISETDIPEFDFNSFMISDRNWVANTYGNGGKWIYK